MLNQMYLLKDESERSYIQLTLTLFIRAGYLTPSPFSYVKFGGLYWYFFTILLNVNLMLICMLTRCSCRFTSLNVYYLKTGLECFIISSDLFMCKDASWRRLTLDHNKATLTHPISVAMHGHYEINWRV